MWLKGATTYNVKAKVFFWSLNGELLQGLEHELKQGLGQRLEQEQGQGLRLTNGQRLIKISIYVYVNIIIIHVWLLKCQGDQL